jgi:heterodisulfide reductase subunit A-like polyferredoxin
MPEHLTASQRRHIESYRRIGTDIVAGQVRIDLDRCGGCSLCASTCPSSALEVVGKKSRMIPGTSVCFSCGCCAAICPDGAIELTTFIQFHGAFRYLDRGEPVPPRKL